MQTVLVSSSTAVGYQTCWANAAKSRITERAYSFVLTLRSLLAMAVGFHPLSFSLYPFKPVSSLGNTLVVELVLSANSCASLNTSSSSTLFISISSQRTSTKHEHGSYHVLGILEMSKLPLR